MQAIKKEKYLSICVSYCMVYALVQEDDPRALASGSSPIQTQNHAKTCLLHQHTFVLYALRESDVKYWNIMKGGIRLIKASIIKKNVKLPANRTLEQTPRIRYSGHAGLKHRLVNDDAAPVLIRSARKQRCYNDCFSCLNF